MTAKGETISLDFLNLFIPQRQYDLNISSIPKDCPSAKSRTRFFRFEVMIKHFEAIKATIRQWVVGVFSGANNLLKKTAANEHKDENHKRTPRKECPGHPCIDILVFA